ncbi:GNAT family N-acetyltransferase [Streptacidiphilus anmyonensis]|uniref:GNAT family N-acetyltransferase n=1 Tax=Streptacidiphilus anmyonensis TaxID=405782 RepID=UPI0005A95ED1|nr:GNAT family N-acetyltransferase [Streptacidiphilus anmyonensis]
MSESYPAYWEADIVLRDGGTARIRPIVPDDADRLVAFYQRVSDQSKYYRFFAPYPRLSAKDVRHFTHHDFVDRVGLAALVNDQFIATVRYDRIDASGRPSGSGTEAEVAFLVQDAHQGRGLASALLEHIAATARERGIRRFVAEVLPENRKMAKVFTEAGYTQQRSFTDGVLHFEFDLAPTEESLAVMRAREHRAEARSMQRLLAPRSVAVIGAGRNPVGVGRTLLRNLLAGGFTGPLYAINPAAADPATGLRELDGVPVHASIADVADPVDLAVVAVPAEQVPDVVADCGAAGVRGLVVITAGYAETGLDGRARQRELVRQARAAGMRVLGPNAFGVINTDPEVRLDASLSPQLPRRGPLGIFTQSGAIGAALLEAAHRRGLGISAFASVGNRADVSGNDLLQFFEEDEATGVALLYLESFGNPRKFSRLARRVAARKPLVVVKGGRDTRSIPAGHAAAITRIADSTVDTLFEQAGVIRVDTITELYDAADLLAHQPLPAGPRIAIVGNSDSLGLLTHDVALGIGLRPLLPHDLTTSATPDDFRRGLRAAIDRPDSDAVVAVVIPPIGAGGFPSFPGSGLISRTNPSPLAVTPPLDLGPLAAALRDSADRARRAAKPLIIVHLALPALVDQVNTPSGDSPSDPAAGGAGNRVGVPGVGAAAAPSPGGSAGDSPSDASVGGTAGVGVPSGATSPAPTPGGSAAAGEGVADGRAPGAGSAAASDSGGSAAAPSDAGGARAAGAGMPQGSAGDSPSEAGVGGTADGGAGDVPGVVFGGTAEGRVPGYPRPERAVRALAHATRYAQWRARSAEPRTIPEFEDVAAQQARVIVAEALGRGRDAVLDAATVARLLACYGVHVEAGAQDDADARQPHDGVFVDTTVSASVDPAVGAILSFGLAGVASELLGDVAHRLIPATEPEAASLIREIKAAPLLFGWRGSEPVDTAALEQLLLRVSQLVDDLPEVASLTMEPVRVGRKGLAVLAADVRLARLPARTDLGPRALA